MSSRIALVIISLHLLVVGMAFATDAKAAIATAFVHLSPVLLFFSLIDFLGADYGGKFSSILLWSVLFNAVKYLFIAIGLIFEGMNGVLGTALVLEALYLLASGLYLAELNIIIG